MTGQLDLFGGAVALQAIDDALAGGPAPSLSPEVFDALDAAGEIDHWDARERAADPTLAVDWADPDAHDLETARWYDRTADPYGPDDDGPCEFLLGTHRPHWLYPGKRQRRPAGPLFVSARQLSHARRTPYPRADTRYAVDSGGFTEIRQHGGWVTTAEAYARQVTALADQTGTLAWAAAQDWMVEPDALAATGLTVEDHQRLTVERFLELRRIAPWVRWLPVLQGQTLAHYVDHAEQYRAAGVDLRTVERVGVGSICRRQRTDEIVEVLAELRGRGLRLHGFGVKTAGLRRCAGLLASADSLAWSFAARRQRTGGANDQHAAEAFRERMDAITSASTVVVVVEAVDVVEQPQAPASEQREADL
jgi:hypothetical protein